MRPVVLTTDDASGGAVGSAVCPLDIRLTPFQVTVQVVATGTVDYDLQYTNDDVFAEGFDPATADWTTHTGMDGATASGVATLISPVSAIRLLQNSGDGSLAARVIQAGW